MKFIGTIPLLLAAVSAETAVETKSASEIQVGVIRRLCCCLLQSWGSGLPAPCLFLVL